MARYDKYEPKGGGFRAALASDQAATPGAFGEADGPVAVGLDSSGEVVLGEGNSGIVGVLCLTADKKAGDIVDVMSDGDVVEFGGSAGTFYYGRPQTDDDGEADGGSAAGSITIEATSTVSTASVDNTPIGYTIEVGRLVVRAGRSA